MENQGPLEGCFLVSPRARHCIVGFCPETSRMAFLKLRVPCGKCSVCCIHAPHSGRPRDERQYSYQKLAQRLLSRSQHGPLMFMRDFNARLHGRLDSDPESIGMHIFRDGPRVHEPDCSRSLLLELCQCCRLSIANTFFNEPPQRQVTCYSEGASPNSELTPKNFGEIDLSLISHDWLPHVSQLFSCMELPLATHHFLLLAKMHIHVPEMSRTEKHSTCKQVLALQGSDISNAFAHAFDEEMQQRSKLHDGELASSVFCEDMTAAFKVAAHKCLNPAKTP